MRAVVQRCTKASVSVENEVISSIGKGLCILVGISKLDTKKDMDYMVRKILNLRIFDDNGKRWSSSVREKQLEILCVSQFTLYSVLKGNKPDFHMSMAPDTSMQFYSDFVASLKQGYCDERVKDGKFGAYMQVSIQNDGPVTINLESPLSSKNESQPEES